MLYEHHSRRPISRAAFAHRMLRHGALALALTLGSIAAIGINVAGVQAVDMLFLVAAMCLVSAWIAQRLHLACD